MRECGYFVQKKKKLTRRVTAVCKCLKSCHREKRSEVFCTASHGGVEVGARGKWVFPHYKKKKKKHPIRNLKKL